MTDCLKQEQWADTAAHYPIIYKSLITLNILQNYTISYK